MKFRAQPISPCVLGFPLNPCLSILVIFLTCLEVPARWCIISWYSDGFWTSHSFPGFSHFCIQRCLKAGEIFNVGMLQALQIKFGSVGSLSIEIDMNKQIYRYVYTCCRADSKASCCVFWRLIMRPPNAHNEATSFKCLFLRVSSPSLKDAPRSSILSK